MRRRTSRGTTRRWMVTLLAVSLAACSVLEPKPDRTRNYLLAAQTQPSPATSSLVVGVGPVELPAYLDRAAIVTRDTPNQLRYSSLDRWAEPLRDNFARVLATDLGAALGTNQVVQFPARFATEVDYRVEVDVDQLERTGNDLAVVAARWELRQGPHGRVLLRTRSVHEVAIDGRKTADLVEALSRATALLADEIAAAIAAAEPQP